MSARRLLTVLAGLLTVGFSPVRDPSLVTAIKWSSPAVTVVIQDDGVLGIADGSDLVAIRAALAVWGTPACTSFNFVDGGTSPTGGASNDGVNRISFTDAWGYDAGIVALTERTRNLSATPQRWQDVDIIANEATFAWATDGDLYAYDVQSVITHELGHVVGLAHSPVVPATMYFGYAKGLTSHRTLDADDVKGVCFLYPAASFACATDADCPFYQGTYGGADVATRCSAPNCTSGAAGYGAACSANGDCTSAKCLLGLDGAPAGQPGVCTQNCTASPNNCPGSALCHADTTGAGLGNVCYPSYVDCAADSECDATSNGYCVHDLDGRFRCLYTCLTNTHCSAIAGAVCQGAVDAGHPGLCRIPGTGGDGVACQDGYDCASLYCSGTSAQPVCGQNATPVDSGPTPDGVAPDTGSSADGGPGADTATSDAGGGDHRTRSDSGGPVVDDGTALVGGCACEGSSSVGGRTASSAGSTAWVGALALGASIVRRRRRR